MSFTVSTFLEVFMVLKNLTRPLLASLVVSILPACGPSINANLETPETEVATDDVHIMSGEQFLMALTDDQAEIESLGLKGKKQAKKAKKAQAAGKKKKKVGVAAQAKKIAKVNRKEAKESLKRAENLQKARNALRAVNKMPNKGLLQAEDKCKAIQAAVKELREKQNVSAPYGGLRQKLLASLAKDKARVLKANGLRSCAAAKKLADSVPAPLEEEQILDEALAAEEAAAADAAAAEPTVAEEPMALPEGVTIILPDGTVLSGIEFIVVRR